MKSLNARLTTLYLFAIDIINQLNEIIFNFNRYIVKFSKFKYQSFKIKKLFTELDESSTDTKDRP